MSVTVPTVFIALPLVALVWVLWFLAWRRLDRWFEKWFDPKFRRWYWQRHFDGEPPEDWGH